MTAVLQKYWVLLFLTLSVCLSLFFAVYKLNVAPPGFNADEAAFSYNAYSILKTGADEYGTFLPLRLKSFDDYKMPLYTYLSVPIVGIFGLNELSARGLNILLAVFFPIAIYFFAKELFNNKIIGVIGAILISISMGKGIMEREAHEALLAALLITLGSYFFIKFIESQRYRYGIAFVISIFLALFSYQSSRLFGLFFFLFALGYFLLKKVRSKRTIIVFVLFAISLVAFAVTDIIYKPTRVENLFITNTAGFEMERQQLRNEGGSKIFYNPVTIGVHDALYQYLLYFSPQFLAEHGDSNVRFGFQGMSPITPLEYLFIFVGIYFLFKNKERWRYFLLALFLISPITAALSWADLSLTRSFFIIIPGLIIAAYGFYNFVISFKKREVFPYILVGLVIIESLFLFYSWDFYLNHYSKRALPAEDWQAGYQELATYVKANYNNFDTFYITQKNGQPYIFMLFYLKYPPQEYQKQAELTSPDQFGFGQVEKFDKFNFSIPPGVFQKHHVAVIGYPDDFNNAPIDQSKIKKIIINNFPIFWIYEE